MFLKVENIPKTELYGIRNKDINKIITVGLLNNKVIFADATNWFQAIRKISLLCRTELKNVMIQ